MPVTRAWLQTQIPTVNPWWRKPTGWEQADVHLDAAAKAPFDRRPTTLDDIIAPNLYTLRGTRRVGKTTLTKQRIVQLIADGVDPRSICFFSAEALSAPDDLVNLFQVARGFFPDLPGHRFFFIDEVTSIPNWFRGLAWLRGNSPVATDCVVATGSSASDVAAGAEALAGRRGTAVGLDRLLLPMSFPQFVQAAGYSVPNPGSISAKAFVTSDGRTATQAAHVYLPELSDAFDHYLRIGGFPQAVAGFKVSAAVPDGFIRDLWDVVQADLRKAGVQQVQSALRVIEHVARNLSSPFEYLPIATALGGISPHTVAAWIDTLADNYLLFRVLQQENWLPAPGKQRKVYPVDPLITHLPGFLSQGAAQPDPSHVAEAVVAAALLRNIEGDRVDRFGQPERLFLWRNPKTDTEIDFITHPDYGFEVKYTDAAAPGAARTMERNGFRNALVLSRASTHDAGTSLVIPTCIFVWLLEQQG